MYWSFKELLESNNLLAGWSGFELRSTPLQSKKITATAPTLTTTTTRSYRTLCDVSALALSLNFEDPGS